MGNFFNSEILGRPTLADWGVVFTRVDQVPRHPVQLYESFLYLLIFLFLFGLERRKGRTFGDGFYTGAFFAFAFGGRFFLEFFKESQTPLESYLPVSMGQLLSIPVVLFGFALMVYSFRRAKKV